MSEVLLFLFSDSVFTGILNKGLLNAAEVEHAHVLEIKMSQSAFSKLQSSVFNSELFPVPQPPPGRPLSPRRPIPESETGTESETGGETLLGFI